MITYKFVIDITRSNINNIPAVYLFLNKLFQWLEQGAASEICNRKKNYVGIYFSDADFQLEQKNCSCSSVFERGEDFLKDFANRKILNGCQDGKDDVMDALNLAIHVGRTPEAGKVAKDIIFLFTDQTLEEEYEFLPAENRELRGVFLFADYSVNTKEKDFMGISFPILSNYRTAEPAIQYDWNVLKETAKGIPDSIIFPLEKFMGMQF